VKYLPLLWANLMRRKARTLFTLLSVVVAFILFGYLVAIQKAFEMGADVAGADRLLTIHKMSLIQPLPISYLDLIRAVQGVAEATHGTWFGGIYKDPKNFFGQFAVDGETYLRMYPEFLIPEDQVRAWLDDRTGAIAGRAIVDRFGWKIGDRIPIQATVWRQSGDDSAWEFTLAGIYDGKEKATDTTQFLFHYKYFDEKRGFGQGLVGWYIVQVDDPDDIDNVARRVDALFANSPAETKTASEKAFVQGFAAQVGNVAAIIKAVMAAVFFTLLVVAGNAAAQSVRERTSELAVLKTLGFSDRQVLGIVLGESILLVGTGCALGLTLAWFMVNQGDPTGGFLPLFFLPPASLLAGAAFGLLLGLLSGAIPAISAMRLSIVDALRRN
jgi:putative ABC transport system permease protein